jgi:hypothetical protein
MDGTKAGRPAGGLRAKDLRTGLTRRDEDPASFDKFPDFMCCQTVGIFQGAAAFDLRKIVRRLWATALHRPVLSLSAQTNKSRDMKKRSHLRRIESLIKLANLKCRSLNIPAMKPSELFGVFVRAAGFVIVLYGLYEI